MTQSHTTTEAALADEELRLIDAYWRAANYLSVGQIYLLDNPLLREPLQPEHVKPRLLGHFGTTPGLNLIYAHLNRAIRARDLERDLHHRARPRRARRSSRTPTSRAPTASSTRSVGRDEDGLRAALPAVLVPRRDPEPRRARDARARSTRAASSATRSSHAFGAAFDNPDLLVACVVGDGEAETGPARGELALEQVPQPEDRRRRAADPAPERLQDREPDRARPHPRARSCVALFEGYGWRPILVSVASTARTRAPCTSASPPRSTRRSTRSREIQRAAREDGADERPRWPMIVLRTPKGWTGPKEVDGLPVEGTWRSHQVPLAEVRGTARSTCRSLEEWLRSYRPEELFDEDGALVPELRGARRRRASGA